jgi:(methylthio)acryloyl-CoA hydratase
LKSPTQFGDHRRNNKRRTKPVTTNSVTNDPSINLAIRYDKSVAIIEITRAKKRNALNDALVFALRRTFEEMPSHIRSAVLCGSGEHFCAGLDLSDLKERDAGQGVLHSRGWHSAMDTIQFARIPVVAALKGAVVGGGLELASACHIRVADASTFYALPEGSRGIYVGGGGSVRISKLVGVARMTDMMLTGRVYNAVDGERLGFAQYLVDAGASLDKAIELAHRITENAPLTNYALVQALPRIAEQSADHGHFTEALMSAIAQSAPEAKDRLNAFLEGRAEKVKKAD